MVHNWPEGKQPARNLSQGMTIHRNSHVWVNACRQAKADVKVLKAILGQSFSSFLWRAKHFGLSFSSCNSSLLDRPLFVQSLHSRDSFWQTYHTPHWDHNQKSIHLLYKGPNPDKECTAGVNALFWQKIKLYEDFCFTLSLLVQIQAMVTTGYREK